MIGVTVNLCSSLDLQDGLPGHSRLRPELDSDASCKCAHHHCKPRSVQLHNRRYGFAQPTAGFDLPSL